jgi:hypothetical protein
VGEKLHHLIEGKCPIDVSFRAGSLDSIIGTFCNAVKKPVYALFFCGGVERVVVGHLSDDLFKKINVLGNVSAMNVFKCFNCVAESLAPLL